MAALKEDLAAAQERVTELEAVLQSSSPGLPSDKEARKVTPCPAGLCSSCAESHSECHLMGTTQYLCNFDTFDTELLWAMALHIYGIPLWTVGTRCPAIHESTWLYRALLYEDRPMGVSAV